MTIREVKGPAWVCAAYRMVIKLMMEKGGEMADKWHSCCLPEYSAGRHVAQSLDGCFWHFATSLCDFFIFLFVCISLSRVLCTRCCTAAKIKPKWKLQNKKKLRNKVVNGQDAEKLGEKNVSMENNPNTMRIAARCQLTRLMFFILAS